MFRSKFWESDLQYNVDMINCGSSFPKLEMSDLMMVNGIILIQKLKYQKYNKAKQSLVIYSIEIEFSLT